MADYTSFRQRLDAVLRTLDVQQVSKFLIAEHQWDQGVPPNPEFAMWMMIAGSPGLRDLHETARDWLVAHGFEGEAQAVLDREKGGRSPAKGSGNKQRAGGGAKRQKQDGSAGSSKKPAGGSQQPRGQRKDSHNR